MAVVGAASAQSSVTLYGIADIWVGKPEGAKVQAGSGGLAGSRWGIKGSEDLGGGLSANFNFESAVNLGNGATNAAMFDRQANVGFSGGFGALKIGRSWTAFDDIYGAANSGFDSALSANAVWINNYAYSNGTNAYPTGEPILTGESTGCLCQFAGDAVAGCAVFVGAVVATAAG